MTNNLARNLHQMGYSEAPARLELIKNAIQGKAKELSPEDHIRGCVLRDKLHAMAVYLQDWNREDALAKRDNVWRLDLSELEREVQGFQQMISGLSDALNKIDYDAEWRKNHE